MDYTLTLRDLATDLAAQKDKDVVGICHHTERCWGASALARKYGRPFWCINYAAWAYVDGQNCPVEMALGVEAVLDAFDALDTRCPGRTVDMLPQTKAQVTASGILQAAYMACSGCLGSWCDGCVPDVDLLFAGEEIMTIRKDRDDAATSTAVE